VKEEAAGETHNEEPSPGREANLSFFSCFSCCLVDGWNGKKHACVGEANFAFFYCFLVVCLMNET